MKKIKIIFEDDAYLVIDKPAGLLVHGGPHIKEESLVDWLLKKYPKIKEVGEDPFRPGIVHRLDKEVSGLMIVAKTQEAFRHFKKQFQSRRNIKEYTALVYGKIIKDSDEINFPIKRASVGFKMAAVPKNFESENKDSKIREAISQFEVIKKFINYSLLKVRIKTGRTHQIRVHLSAYGYPLVGDDLYSTKKTRIKNKKNQLGRIFLQATQLSFKDPKGEKKSFSLALAPELQDFLSRVK